MLDCLMRPFLCVAICLLMVIGVLCACEHPGTNPEYNYYYKVYRQNCDGTVTEWEVHKQIKINGAFVTWEQEHGVNFCISGTITLVPIIIEIPQAQETETKKQD